MVKKVIFTGIEGNDATGDPIREAFEKTNSNFTELYAAFGKGGGFPFTSLEDYDPDRNQQLVSGTVFMVNDAGDTILAKTLIEGSGITIDSNSNSITFTSTGASLNADTRPLLGYHLNANGYGVGNMSAPTQTAADALGVSIDTFAVTKGYADTRYVNSVGDTMTGNLSIPFTVNITDFERLSNFITVTTEVPHCLSTGDSVTVLIDIADAPVHDTATVYLEGALAKAIDSDTYYECIQDTISGVALTNINFWSPLGSLNSTNITVTEINKFIYANTGPDFGPVAGTVKNYGIVPLAKRTVDRLGGLANQMRGPLILSRNPEPADDTDYDGLVAATKKYVDTASFSSTVNLYVSTNGNDFRFDIPDEKRGSAFAYAFRTINAACFKAGQIIQAAANELGPYQKSVFYNSSSNPPNEAPISTVAGITPSGSRYNLDITNGNSVTGTDMRGTGTAESFDIRAGLLFRGRTTGAVAIIDFVGAIGTGGLAGTERYQVRYTLFHDVEKTQPIEFVVGEELEYGDPVKQPNIAISIESGEYYENYPIRVPSNVSISGDDLRRVLIRPRSGPSGSIWSDIYFRRDKLIDGLTVVDDDDEFGYHYLIDSTRDFYTKTVISPGGKENAQKIIYANLEFLKAEIHAYVIDEYAGYYTTDQLALCNRDVESIINALMYDLLHGSYSKSLEAAMSYYMNASALEVIGAQLTKTLDMLDKIGNRVKQVLTKSKISNPYQNTVKQIIDFNYTAEGSSNTVIDSLLTLMVDIIDPDPLVINFPKNNNQMDLFLLNDSNRIRTLSGQGHGGFMCVLDPEGQILNKSPYIQQVSSFARSTNQKNFSGGAFVDAFTGNLTALIADRNSPTVFQISGLRYRVPQTPCSFYVEGVRFQIDYVSNYVAWNGTTGGTAQLNINPNTPDTLSYTQSVSDLIPEGSTIEILTAGNRSMLASDFTQLNDLGYGIFVTNNALFEAVSVFCYYNHRAFYSLNGGQIRSLNGSCAYGNHALSSEGSDPTEKAGTCTLKYKMVQTLPTYSIGDLSDVNKKGDLAIYVTINPSTKYVPFSNSEVEIDHGVGSVNTTYLIKNAVATTITNVYILNISTAGNTDTGSLSLNYDVPNGTNIIIRNIKEFELLDLKTLSPTRPSNALEFTDDYNIYHILQYIPVEADNTVNGKAAIVDLNESIQYLYISPLLVDGVNGALADTTLDIEPITDANDLVKIATGKMVFAWGNTTHRITSYTAPVVSPAAPARITFTTGLSKTALKSAYVDRSVYLKAGWDAGVSGLITTQISLVRASGHDLADIGTGGYADSNYPNNIYGNPVNTKDQSKEVQEIGKGRVFYATTDQDGNVRFGKYFRVNQGTGSVSFSANVAISNLDGLGFTRGAQINEFSIDATMSRHSPFVVPVESAISDFVSRRLGLTYPAGTAIANDQKLGPGFMPRNGVLAATANMNLGGFQISSLAGPTSGSDAANKTYTDTKLSLSGGTMTGVINMGDNKIINLATPTNDKDAATKLYVNDKSNISALNDVVLTDIANYQLLRYNSVSSKWVNALLTNDNVSASAAIAQSKLNLSDATAAAAAVDATKGISSFNNANFGVSSGYVSIKDSGVTLAKLANMNSGYVLGNNSGAATAPLAITFAAAVNEAITSPEAGLVTRGTGVTFSITRVTNANTASTVVYRDANGDFSAGTITASLTGIATKADTLKFSGDYRSATNTNTGNTIVARDSNGDFAAGTITATATQSLYADLAEYYEGDQDYEAGTVVMIGGDKEVTIAKGIGTTKVAGVVSTNPAYSMNIECQGIKIAIALQGRVPCKVVGKVSKGDLIVTSMIPGVGMASEDPKAGSIIGKALGDYDSDRIGIIEVLVGKH